MSASSVRPRVSLATRSAADICAAVATGTSRAAIVGSAARLTSARRAQDDLEEIEAALVDAERIDRRLRSAAQHLACATCVSLRRARPREQRARALEHAGRRVHADREPHACGDAAQRVADAASEVKRDLMRDGIRERQHRVEVLASRVRWALEVRLREWRPLTTRLVSHVTILTRMHIGRFQVEIYKEGIFRLGAGAMCGDM